MIGRQLFGSLWSVSVLLAHLPGCTPQAHSDVIAEVSAGAAMKPEFVEPVPAETSLGVRDHGIWSDLDDRVELRLPAGLRAHDVRARIDLAHRLLIVSVDGWPVKPYPLDDTGTGSAAEYASALRPGDRAELAGLLHPSRVEVQPDAEFGDRDADGVPDPLDVLIGAKKTVLNADAYQGGYHRIGYPMGDVPRELGVCTDVIVRAVRNAGVDLQRELHEDIARSPRSYPMLARGPDTSIDHRRVKTLLPYFLRAWQRRSASLDDPSDPLRPGDVVLMDTFPARSGPDHIGIVSDHRGASGQLLIINNWTDGTVTAEMDLLPWVPVTHRFRLGRPRPRDPAAGRHGHPRAAAAARADEKKRIDGFGRAHPAPVFHNLRKSDDWQEVVVQHPARLAAEGFA
jgi:uncharacterized protein